MALGGTLAALAVVIMTLGGMIPLATFCCPVLACFLLVPVLLQCGGKIAWAWYGAVALLSVLLGPDKEAAGVFAALGYYPILKPWLDKLPKALGFLCKALLFNCSIVLMYLVLIWVMGMDALGAEFREAGALMLGAMLLLGNVTFFLVDVLVGRMTRLFQVKYHK